jgi:hypothetical protein
MAAGAALRNDDARPSPGQFKFNPFSPLMNDIFPFTGCPLKCGLQESPLCVRNLVMLSGDRAPITFGLNVGLNQLYESGKMPPCVRGPLGSAYWSVHSGPGAVNCMEQAPASGVAPQEPCDCRIQET